MHEFKGSVARYILFISYISVLHNALVAHRSVASLAERIPIDTGLYGSGPLLACKLEKGAQRLSRVNLT
jgi:hypothetical protein